MFALSTSRIVGSAVKLSVKSRVVRARRAASIRVRAEGEAEKVAVVEDMKAADAAWTETAADAAPVTPAAFSAAIDPADGSVAEAAPLGDDMSMLNDAMIAFKEPRAVEIINGRVAMIGWMAALSAEISNDQSLTRQVLNTRTFTLADGVHKVNHTGLGVQEASSYIAGLTARPYWDVHGGSFPWMVTLEKNFETIRDELRAGLANPDVERLGNSVWVPAVRDDADGYGPDWRTLVLQDRGEWEPTNCGFFPKTVALVKAAGTPSVEVFFAKQAPQTGIKPHTDFTNFIMTSHLGLDVPPAPQSWMKVGEETRYWENGKGMCADTSFIHSTYNESETEDRYVLIIRFWHPELTDHEKNGVQFLFDAFEDLDATECLAKAVEIERVDAFGETTVFKNGRTDLLPFAMKRIALELHLRNLGLHRGAFAIVDRFYPLCECAGESAIRKPSNRPVEHIRATPLLRLRRLSLRASRVGAGVRASASSLPPPASSVASGPVLMADGAEKDARLRKMPKKPVKFEGLRDDEIGKISDDLKAASAPHVRADVHALLFGKDFRAHIQAVEHLEAALSESPDAVEGTLDLTLRWVVLRLCEQAPNTQSLLKVLDFTADALAVVKDRGARLSEQEAAIKSLVSFASCASAFVAVAPPVNVEVPVPEAYEEESEYV